MINISSEENYIEAKKLIEKNFKFIARDRTGELCAFYEEPIKWGPNWITLKTEGVVLHYDIPVFEEVSWKDQEPVFLESIVKHFKPDLSKLNTVSLSFPRKIPDTSYPHLYRIEYIDPQGFVQFCKIDIGLYNLPELFSEEEANKKLWELSQNENSCR